MQPITTLNDFFERSGAEVSLFHMGRRVTMCAQETLAALEKQQAPWPEPWQGQARLGILFHLGNMPEPAIWFLAFPLDEQGYLAVEQRDAFLQRLLETLGRNARNIDTGNGENIEHLMQDNPLSFTPSTHFQAMFNARATQHLKLPASQHFEAIEAYICQQITLDWQALGLQGIADFVVRMDTAQSAQLSAMLPALPIEMLHAVAYCLEHVALSHTLAQTLIKRGKQAAHQEDLETLCACIRAIGSTSEALVGQWYQQLLSDTVACGPDTLAAIAGRGWIHLEHGERLPLFLNRLAEDPRTDFAVVIRDLALIPRLRLPIIMLLKDAKDGSPLQQRLAALTPSAAKADD